jgi:FtsP/CotA-like multicopper oxidase with cupredoxin domain
MLFCSLATLCGLIVVFTNQFFAHAATVPFEIHASWTMGAPDGNRRQMITVNNQFPGPQLTLNQGDQVQVRCSKPIA